jgi:AcrR family transcriptional regulator
VEERVNQKAGRGNGGARRHHNGARAQQEARYQQGLEEILSKSSRMMAEVGFHGTSMRQLSRATGRSLSGLYHYFASKEDLLYLINYHGFTTLNETWKKMSASFDTPEERLYGFVYLHTHYYVANIDEMRVMNWGTQELEYERAMAIKKLKDRHTTAARAIIKELHGDAVSPRQLARRTFLLFGMMNWIFGWYSGAAHGAVDDLIRDIYSTFMYGLHREQERAEQLGEIEAKARDSYRRHSTSNIWETAPAPNLNPTE